jgi:hypothetical protein
VAAHSGGADRVGAGALVAARAAVVYVGSEKVDLAPIDGLAVAVAIAGGARRNAADAAGAGGFVDMKRRARQFMRDLQSNTAAAIAGGMAAIPHWGLENDFLNASLLQRLVNLLPASAPMKAGVGRFRQVRQRIAAAGPTPVAGMDVFANAFRSRLGL